MRRESPGGRMVMAAAVVLAGAAEAGEAADPRLVLNTVFPRDVEIALAVTGGPVHVRRGATVYVYGPNGYEKAREGTNGFTCLVNRDGYFYGADNFKPTCWDAEGRASYVPVMLRAGELLAQGKTADEARADIDAGFQDGRFKRPSKGGVAYMSAGDVKLDASGKVAATVFPGHMMFYAPGLTNGDLGTTPEALKSDRTLPFVFSAGAGGVNLAYIIAMPRH